MEESDDSAVFDAHDAEVTEQDASVSQSGNQDSFESDVFDTQPETQNCVTNDVHTQRDSAQDSGSERQASDTEDAQQNSNDASGAQLPISDTEDAQQYPTLASESQLQAMSTMDAQNEGSHSENHSNEQDLSSSLSQANSLNAHGLSNQEIEGLLDGTWSRRFFLDYIYVEGKQGETDYSSIIPTSSAIHFEYIMKTYKENAKYPVFRSKEVPARKVYSYHDGMTSLNENVWWVIEVAQPGISSSETFEKFPSDLTLLFNTVKIKTFSK
jgi:hypothetical protein